MSLSEKSHINNYSHPEVVTFPLGEVLEPEMQPQSQQIMTVRYFGHMDETTTTDTLYYTLHTPEGYIALDDQEQITSWNYFRRDHLGNNVAVWNATADTTVQRMFYYPSGLPLNLSTNQGTQPYKYNGKEYDEMHGYDVYDYGFRGYYATIARFTSPDPLSEQTPWQSPYTYASNNFIGEIDWMGLFGSSGFASGSYGICQYVVLNEDGLVIGYDLTSPDHHVYMVDKDEWDGKYESLKPSQIIGWEIPGWKKYVIGQPCYYLGSVTRSYYTNGALQVVGSTALMYGLSSVTRCVDDSPSALIHYWFGFGSRIALGDFLTRRKLMSHPDFIKYQEELLNGLHDKTGYFGIDMKDYIFHIGNTQIYYYSTENYTVFSIGVGDAFCDALYVLEKGKGMLDLIEPDGMGWKLELGFPYEYIPTAVLIPNK